MKLSSGILTLLVAGCPIVASCSGSIEPAGGGPTAGKNSANSAGGVGTPNSPGGNSETGNGTLNGGNTNGAANGGAANGGAANGGAANGGATGTAAQCVRGTTVSSQLPRLTNNQYDNTVYELTGLELGLSGTTLAADSRGDIDARTWQGYQAAGKAVTSAILANATAKQKVLGCTSADDACAHQMVAQFGAKVFRRPLSDAEQKRFEQRYLDRAKLTETGSFDEGMAVVLESMLTSPSFLTRAEVTQTGTDAARVALSNYEVASRLSFMLWDSMPDETLFKAAAAGKLTAADGIRAETTRMLQDARAHALVTRFHEHYLIMGAGTRWVDYTRQGKTFSKDLPSMLTAETQKLAESVVFAGGSFKDLLTTTKGFVNAKTAPLYGLSASNLSATDLSEVDLGSGRPGILTRAGFLAANAYADRPSPIHRGAFLEKHVLCRVIGAPDPNAALTPLPTDDASLRTNRQRVQAQTSIATACIDCHNTLINPAGFVFESFDQLGQVRTTDNGDAIDTAASVAVGGSMVNVANATELMAQIAVSPEGQRCYSESWTQFAYDRELSADDACTVQDIATRMANPSYTILNLITDLTQPESFRFRAVGAQ